MKIIKRKCKREELTITVPDRKYLYLGAFMAFYHRTPLFLGKIKWKK